MYQRLIANYASTVLTSVFEYEITTQKIKKMFKLEQSLQDNIQKSQE